MLSRRRQRFVIAILCLIAVALIIWLALLLRVDREMEGVNSIGLIGVWLDLGLTRFGGHLP